MRFRPAVATLLVLLPLACTNTSSSNSTSSSGNGDPADAGPDDAGARDAGRRDAGGGGSVSVVQGHLLSPNGAFGVYEGLVWVDFEVNGQTQRRQSSTRFDGRFTLNGLPAGTHTLHGERGLYAGTATVTLETSGSTVTDADILVSAGNARFVVVTGQYDSVGEIVSGLGLPTVEVDGIGGFLDPTPTWFADTVNDAYLADKTALLLNCGITDDVWERPDLELRRQTLRQWIASGHSLYASDWAYDFVEWLFPEVLNFHGDDNARNAAQDGNEELVAATVSDETLFKLVGGSLTIDYDLPAWAVLTGLGPEPDGGVPAADGGSVDDGGVADGGAADAAVVVDAGSVSPVATTVTVLVRGTVHVGNREYEDVPLAVKIKHGAGTVVFTTFHNEAQLDATVLTVLRYMIMRL
jgi:hypothetical protein